MHTIINCITYMTSNYSVTVPLSVLLDWSTFVHVVYSTYQRILTTAFFIRSVHTIIDYVTHRLPCTQLRFLLQYRFYNQLTTAFFIRSVHTIIDCVTHPTSVYTVTVLTLVPILHHTYDSLLHPKRPHNHWLRHKLDFHVHSYGSYFSTDSTTNLRQPSSSEASTQSLTASHTRLPCTQLRFLLQYRFYNLRQPSSSEASTQSLTASHTRLPCTQLWFLLQYWFYNLRQPSSSEASTQSLTASHTRLPCTQLRFLLQYRFYNLRQPSSSEASTQSLTASHTRLPCTQLWFLLQYWFYNLRQPSSSEASTQSLTASHTRLPCTQLRFLLQYWFYNQLTTAFFIRSVHTIIDCITHPTSVYTVTVLTSVLIL